MRRDVNSILESIGAPEVFAQEYRSFVDDVRVNSDQIKARLDTMEEMILMDHAVESKGGEKVFSEGSAHRSDKHISAGRRTIYTPTRIHLCQTRPITF